ncbi:MAG: NAD(P)/FAD-dependent oxidoreductase [Oscillospiraceae bacterium]|nr:NAD(P)/FAD-dependent oxidoreductase [Oscillospiraceae bacterium]
MISYDGIVVGGGPAGMFAAITAARRGARVLLLEKNNCLGKKLLITGKGRCNVTNDCTEQEVLQNIPRNGRFLYSAMTACPPSAVMRFFQELGCPLKTERGNRVFPVTDRSQSVLDCLERELRNQNVTVKTQRVQRILQENGVVTGVETHQQKIYADWVILATGGLSYPTTGSTGDGFEMANALGHTVTPTEGSLVPLEADGTDCQDMQGLSLRNVGVRLLSAKGKLLYKDFGELLFTHFGVSGPTVLSASAHLKGDGCRLVIDLKPALEENKLDGRILRDLEMYQNRSMENALTDLLPRSMIPVVLRRAQIDPVMQANSLTKQKRRELVQLLKAFEVDILGKRPIAEAIITSGGIKVSQIDPKTMESKLVKGLYFAGEMIDCDAYTGGFNLQIAWATARAAGMAVKTAIDKPARM